ADMKKSTFNIQAIRPLYYFKDGLHFPNLIQGHKYTSSNKQLPYYLLMSNLERMPNLNDSVFDDFQNKEKKDSTILGLNWLESIEKQNNFFRVCKSRYHLISIERVF